MSSAPDPCRIAAILDFVQASEQLKDTLRSGVTRQGRPESTAEHSWRLCLMALLFHRDLGTVDLLHLLKLCLVHDLGEAISGDVPAVLQGGDSGRAARERQDLIQLCEPLPDDLASEVLALADEYAQGVTPEAIMAKGFDKLETMLQHLIGRNAQDFDYGFNLSYGRAYTDRDALLSAVRRQVDRETLSRIEAQSRDAIGI
ncbi:putative hydrolase of HD superfamily [Caulobacter ginsengisoli]|uniref:Hydrolase of HD superfamily n=1 Tax=Caulobacter ginsengisoli TaxID=400775 RepID=A0ABU0J0E0_9CAUL|nr:HD domain-containing protein [Caulobacter ginsengisoli]MDQ0466754.1 putative hydrolase of HD superfamily [Caulobacter ginsengisoli]